MFGTSWRAAPALLYHQILTVSTPKLPGGNPQTLVEGFCYKSVNSIGDFYLGFERCHYYFPFIASEWLNAGLVRWDKRRVVRVGHGTVLESYWISSREERKFVRLTQ
jgi:hypothetical protein